MRLNKKGLTLQEGLNAVIIVGLIGLFLGFFALFNDEFSDVADPVSGSVVNETGAYINGTGYTVLKASSATGSTNFVAIVARNVTGNAVQVINAGNYSLNISNGRLTNLTNVIWANVSISYTYTTPSSAQNVTQGINVEFENQTDILGLVLLAVFFGIAISALIGSFLVNMFRNRV